MTASLPSQEQQSQKHGKILIVDDEAELTAALCEMLTKQGFETKGFTNGNEALVSLSSQSYDILLADLMMPAIDGISLLKASLDIDPHLIGIIMTGQGTVQTAVEAMKTGAFDYLLKPFKLNTVMTVLQRSLEVRQLRVENIQMREMLNIYELAQVIAFTLDTNVIFEKTSQAALEQCQADEVSILLPDGDRDNMVMVSNVGDHRESLIGQKVSTHGTVAGWVAQHREPLTLEGEVNDPRFAPAHPRQDIQSSVSMPMILGNKLVGILNVNKTRRAHPLTQGQIRALSLLVSIAASALENSRLYQQTEKRLARLAALRTIDLAISSSLDLRVTLNILLEQVSTQLSADAAAVFLLDPNSQILEYAAGRGFHTSAIEHIQNLLGVGYAGSSALERRTVQIPDLTQAGPDPNREALITDEGLRACFITPLVTKGRVEGVLEVFQRTVTNPDTEWVEFFESLAGQAAIAIDSGRLFDNLQQSNQQLKLAYNATIEGWSAALDLRDQETEGHTQRVTEMMMHLAHVMGGFDEDELVHIRQGALLHDIGKMGVPDGILLKPGPLTDEEWVIMRKHPEFAYRLLAPITYLRKALDIPYYHHERWDGSGYPQGLEGYQIPLAARIFMVVDVWDALRSDRPYRKGWPEEKVVDYLKERSGKDFDSQIVSTFLSFPHS